jgi:hypothetical protein
MSYEFQCCLYRCESELLAAIAESFMTAVGSWEREDVLAETRSDAVLARECVLEWGLDQPHEDDAELPSDLDEWGVTEADIARAIGEYRKALAQNEQTDAL